MTLEITEPLNRTVNNAMCAAFGFQIYEPHFGYPTGSPDIMLMALSLEP